MKVLGKNIKKLRESRGLTQPKLAEVIGVSSFSTVSKWESGKNSPRGRELVLLSKYFNVSVDDLLGINQNGEITTSSEYDYYPVSISAGLPNNVDGITNNDVKRISIPDNIMGDNAGDKNIFFIRANGDSMNNVFPDGSLLAVKQVPLSSLHDSDIVVYSCNYDYAVKRFYHDRKKGKFIFQPDSSDKRFIGRDITYEEAKDLNLYGKVVLYIVNLD